MRKLFLFALFSGCLLSLTASLLAQQVPQLLSYQGRVAVGTSNFDGNGAFKFSLVNGDGSVTYWSNDGTGSNGSEPTAAVTIPVTQGLYSVLLGDTNLAHMTPIPISAFANADVRLRIWFSDGTHTSQRLDPDQRIAAVGYAIASNATQIPDGSITTAKIQANAITSALISPGAVTPDRLAQEYSVFEERQPNGDPSASSFANGWNTRVFNTTVAASGSSIFRIGDSIVLAPGTYYVDAQSITSQASPNKAALFDITGTTTAALVGTTDQGGIQFSVQGVPKAQTQQTGAVYTSSLVKGYVVVGGSAHTYQLRHFYTVTGESGGAAAPTGAGSGLPEVYTTVHVLRVKLPRSKNYSKFLCDRYPSP